MSLTTLPLEVFNFVIANITPQDKGRGGDGRRNETERLDLRNLAQCSRQCYLWTVPHLYSHVIVHEKTKEQYGRLRNLASLLSQRPDLAQIVRAFTLHARNDLHYKLHAESDEDLEDSQKSDVHGSSQNVKVDSVLETAVNALGLSKEEECDWLSKLGQDRKCHLDLILALLLPTLPNLEKIFLDLETDFQTPHLQRVLRRAARRERPSDTHPPFEALRVFMHSHDTHRVRSTSHIASLLTLPAIQRISGGFGNNKDCILDKNLLELDSSSSSLTSLHLAAYRLSATNLGYILRAPKALKKLSYTLCPHDSNSFTDLHQALRPQENFLEIISIHHNNDFERRGRDRRTGHFGPMASFIGFSNLKVFKIAALLLRETNHGTGHDRLINIFPPSLEKLHLTRFKADFMDLLEAVEHLLAKKSPEQVPLLKNFILEEHKYPFRSIKLKDVLWRDTQETALDRLRTVAAAGGVSFDTILNNSILMRQYLGWFALGTGNMV